MKLKASFITHTLGDDRILVPVGDAGFSGLVRSNPTAAFIIEQLRSDTTQEQIVDAMLQEYHAGRQQISQDVAAVIETLRSIGAIEE